MALKREKENLRREEALKREALRNEQLRIFKMKLEEAGLKDELAEKLEKDKIENHGFGVKDLVKEYGEKLQVKIL